MILYIEREINVSLLKIRFFVVVVVVVIYEIFQFLPTNFQMRERERERERENSSAQHPIFMLGKIYFEKTSID